MGNCIVFRPLRELTICALEGDCDFLSNTASIIYKTTEVSRWNHTSASHRGAATHS